MFVHRPEPHRGVDDDGLQADVMRFMAIIAFCLIAIMALVRDPVTVAASDGASPPPEASGVSVPEQELPAPVSEVAARAERASVSTTAASADVPVLPVARTAPVTTPETAAQEDPASLRAAIGNDAMPRASAPVISDAPTRPSAPREPSSKAVAERPPPIIAAERERPQIAAVAQPSPPPEPKLTTEPSPDPEPDPEPVPDTQPEREVARKPEALAAQAEPARDVSDAATPAAEADEGLSLRFESDRDFLRLLERRGITLHAFRAGETLIWSTTGRFVAAPARARPTTVHELFEQTVPRSIRSALVTTGDDAAAYRWGVTLPAPLAEQISAHARAGSSGTLLIAGDGSIRLATRSGNEG